MRTAALYLRVSTAGQVNEQTIENQRADLTAAAFRHGWRIVATFEDAGISGAKGRDKRPGLDSLLEAAGRREFDIIAAWSVDRLGRSLQHLVIFLGDIHAKGIDLYLHKQGLDTTTPSGRAMFGMLSVFAEFEREMIRDRTKAGIARARAAGKRIGRKPMADGRRENIVEAMTNGDSNRKIARELGCSEGTVRNVRAWARLRPA